MKLTSYLLAAGASVASAQNLSAAIAGQTALSQLGLLVGGNTQLLATLDNMRNVTLLAPSNDALSKFTNSSAGAAAAKDQGALEGLLLYHILNGSYSSLNITNNTMTIPTALTNTTYANVTGGQVVTAVKSGNKTTFFSGLKENSTVTTANITFDHGIIHIIDRVLTLPGKISTTLIDANLTSLAGALSKINATGTDDTLKDVTIFAPNNAAFRAIGSAVANLSTAELRSIIGYHAILGAPVHYSTLLTNSTFKSVAGGELTVSVINGSTFVNSARVVTPDILVANGVIHVIDGVLNPNNTSAAPNGTAATPAPAFSGASSASDVPFTSGVPTPTASVPAAGPATTGAATSATKKAAAPIQTGAMGAAALFGGAAVMVNW